MLHPRRALELKESLAQPQSRAGLAAALTQLKARLDASGLAYEDLSGGRGSFCGSQLMCATFDSACATAAQACGPCCTVACSRTWSTSRALVVRE